MSKIGEKPIKIPESTEVTIKQDLVKVKGKKGLLTVPIPNGIVVKHVEDTLLIKRKRDDKKSKSLHGLIRSLIDNALRGVNKPWEKKLEVVGTGYRVSSQGEDLIFEVGYSHNIMFKKVKGVTLSVEEKNKVVIKGVDKQLVGQIAHQIKIIKKPDPYKGKGIRYEGERLKLKPGKKAKAAGTGV